MEKWIYFRKSKKGSLQERNVKIPQDMEEVFFGVGIYIDVPIFFLLSFRKQSISVLDTVP